MPFANSCSGQQATVGCSLLLTRGFTCISYFISLQPLHTKAIFPNSVLERRCTITLSVVDVCALNIHSNCCTHISRFDGLSGALPNGMPRMDVPAEVLQSIRNNKVIILLQHSHPAACLHMHAWVLQANQLPAGCCDPVLSTVPVNLEPFPASCRHV